MYIKITNQIIGGENFYEAKVLKDSGEGSIQVEFKDGDNRIVKDWIMRPGTGKTCSTFFDYELFWDLPKIRVSTSTEGWVEFQGAAYFHDMSGDLCSAPIISATYEPDWDMETKVADFDQPLSDVEVDLIIDAIR